MESPYIDYLVPNSEDVTDPKVRQALAVATDVTAYIDAERWREGRTPAESIVNPAVPGYQANPAFSGPHEGDPDAAKELLEEAGVTLPYPIKFTYGRVGDPDKPAAALKETWEKAGFKVTLDGLADTTTTSSRPARQGQRRHLGRLGC